MEKCSTENAIYDVADSMDITISHFNSRRGVILLRTFEGGAQMEVMVNTAFPSGGTEIGIEDAKETPAEASGAYAGRRHECRRRHKF